MLKVVLRSACGSDGLGKRRCAGIPANWRYSVKLHDPAQTIFHFSAMTGCTSDTYYDTGRHLGPRRGAVHARLHSDDRVACLVHSSLGAACKSADPLVGSLAGSLFGSFGGGEGIGCDHPSGSAVF